MLLEKRTVKVYSSRHFLYLQALKSLLKCMAKDWALAETQTKRETMVNNARIIKNTTIRCTIMCQFVLICYVSLRLCSNNENKLLFRGYFPYNTSISPNYELTVVGQIIASMYAATTYTGVDTFVTMLVLHACGQLSNLKYDLRNIHSYDKKDLQARLKKIVEKHNYIAWLVLNKSVNSNSVGTESFLNGFERC